MGVYTQVRLPGSASRLRVPQKTACGPLPRGLSVGSGHFKDFGAYLFTNC